MNLTDIVNRSMQPIPWTEGEKIPWDEPEFSRRMLREHLSQEHDAASRRFEIIERHVAWIHHTLLNERPSKVLDLGCGPGFYTSRLAKLGHSCTGIDFSPASIEFARKKDEEEKTGCTYIQHDLRTFDFGTGYDLVMLIYGEFNTFRKKDARDILVKAREALSQSGLVLVELNSFSCLKSFGKTEPGWHSNHSGLFSDRPYLLLEESFWNEEMQATTRRIYVIDAAGGEVLQMADNHQAYTEDEVRRLALDCGFVKAEVHSKWPVAGLPPDDDFVLLVAEK
jgi:SAM-dependent methyltransferase